MKTTKICQHCKKVIDCKKDAHYTVRKPYVGGWRGHDYFCYQCGEGIFNEDSRVLNSMYFATLHIHAGKEFNQAGYDPMTILWLVNDDACDLKDFERK